MDPQSNINKLVNFFFTLELNLKIYHWNTTSYPRHKASDELGGKILELTDKFVEIFIGRYKVKPNIERVKIENIFTTDNGNVDLLNQSILFLEDLNTIIKDSDLLNIRDELLGEINKTLYLYRLK
jgi:hypothetical protein